MTARRRMRRWARERCRQEMEAALMNGGLEAGLYTSAYDRGDMKEAYKHANMASRWARRFFHMRKITENHR